MMTLKLELTTEERLVLERALVGYSVTLQRIKRETPNRVYAREAETLDALTLKYLTAQVE